MNLFVRLKEGLSKTRSQITSILSGDGEFDEQFFDSLEDADCCRHRDRVYRGIWWTVSKELKQRRVESNSQAYSVLKELLSEDLRC